MELGGDVVRGTFLGKDLRGKLELSRLMAVKTGFGGQGREEVISKKSKMDLQIPNEKKTWHRSAGLEKRMGKNWLASQCVFEQSGELKQEQLSSRTLIICWKKPTCSSKEIQIYTFGSTTVYV